MATVKEIIDAFCYRNNVPASSSYVGATSPAELQYLSLLEFVGDNLRNRPHNWPQLKRSYTFTTVTNQRLYELPGDFYRLLDSTQWDLTNNWPMRGPISDFNFAVRAYAVVSLQTRKAYRIIGPTAYLFATSPYSQRSAGSFQIDPAGQNNTDQMYMEYLSGSWVWPKDWVTGTAYVTGNLRTGIGNIYRCKASGTSGATRPTGGSIATPANDGTVEWTPYTEPYTIADDADLVLFDKDILVEGMRWAYLKSKGQDYQQERQDWEDMVRSAISRFNGSTRINAGDEMGDNPEWPNIPAGNWSI